MVRPLAAAATAASRRVGGAIKTQTQRRAMGGGPKKEWTGIDKKVRDVFPEDHQRTFELIDIEQNIKKNLNSHLLTTILVV